MEDITLAVVTPDPASDSIITANSLPGLTGNGSSDLLCGGCHEVVAKGLTCDAIGAAFKTQRRLLMACVCGANNLIHEIEIQDIVTD